MAKMIDNQCNVEFPSDAAYLAHKKAGHSKATLKGTPIESPPIPTPPPGVPVEAMPTPEFMEMVNRIEGEKKPAEDVSAPSQHPSELPPTQKIQLTYKYTGECPEHRVTVDTLELDIDKNHFCIAFCPSGKHQIETKQVAKL